MKPKTCTLNTLAVAYCLPLNTPVEAFAPSSLQQVRAVSKVSNTDKQQRVTRLNSTKSNSESVKEQHVLPKKQKSTRRRFIGDFMLSSSGVITASAIANLDLNDPTHPTNCACAGCGNNNNNNNSHVANHPLGCQCDGCVKVTFGPLSVSAYETKDEDGTKRSPDYYAQVIQVRLVFTFYKYMCTITDKNFVYGFIA